MAKLQEAYVVAACRTPVGKAPKGAFSHTRPDDLLAHVIQNVMKKVPDISGEQVDDVIIGCAMPEGAQGMNVARIATLMAGLPDCAPAMTINRFCSSGLQTISQARDKIALGEADVVLAGGVESMSMVPMGGFSYRANPAWFQEENQTQIALSMGITAEKVAKKYDISRDMQDEFALRSHQLAIKAQQSSAFDEEIVPYLIQQNVPHRTEHTLGEKSWYLKQDQGPRKETTFEALSKLKPVFDAKGTVTAGNASQMSDGAGVLMLVSERILNQYDLQPLAKFCGYRVAGVAPELMGIGPVKAIPKVLKSLDLKLADMDWIELNEAFAAQALAVMQNMDMDIEKVNPQGSAIALGHPLGATGAIRACTLVHGLRRTQRRYGMVTMCIGTGMGAAGVFEAL